MGYKNYHFKPFIDYSTHKYGFSLCDVPSNIYKDITLQVDQISQNFKNLTSLGEKLAGVIDHEYKITLPKSFMEWLKGYVNLFNKNSNYIDSFYNLTSSSANEEIKSIQIESMSTWVNFQSKYEYNPMHTHSGLLSWVLWYSIPYSIENEKKQGPGKNIVEGKGNINPNGGFSFVYPLGETIKSEYLPVDKNWNGVIALFPSSLNHQVYPFYTSNEYRITLSGNIGLA